MTKCAICRTGLRNDGRKIAWFNQFFIICKKCAKPINKDQIKSINYYVWFLEIGSELLYGLINYKKREQK